MVNEKSVTKLDDYIGKKIQIVAYGTSYLGTLQKVDYEDGIIIITDGHDTVTIDIDRIESYAGVEE